jgi:hypothetical protein
MRLLPESANSCDLPTFICIGAEKCGTTALYDELKLHPDIYMSPIKETNFFSTDTVVENFRSDYIQHELRKSLDLDDYFSASPLPEIWGAYIKEESHYLNLFSDGKPFAARGEISNSYFYSETAAQNISDTLPAARIILILRNPVHRAYSQYRAMVRDGRTTKDCLIDEILHDQKFTDRRWGSCHGYIDHGLYSTQLERLFATIDRSRIKVVISEEFFLDRESILNEILQFISVNNIIDKDVIHNRNRSIAPRNAKFIRWLTKTGIKSHLSSVVPVNLRSGLKKLFYSEERQSISNAEYKFLESFFIKEKEKTEALLNREIHSW